MGRQAKRTRVVAAKNAASAITCKPHVDSKGYASYLVQGWKEDGKWQRRQFKDENDAKRFAALKRVEMENQGRAQRMVLSPLTEAQHAEAVQAFDKLGTTYTLEQAVTFFLKHHRPPDFTIRLSEALKLYLDDKERDGIRPRTLKAIQSVAGQFIVATNDPWTHEVPASAVESFLRGLRAKDRTSKATRKTWNNYRNELHALFAWCVFPDASTNRPFLFENPVTSVRKFSSSQVREGQSSKVKTTTPADVHRLFSTLLRWRGGIMLRYFAYLYFAGVRPDELQALSKRQNELVNLKTRTIIIPANLSKTRQERHVHICDALAAWLAIAPPTIRPTNFDRLAKRVRKHFGLTHDEPRHSFISYHVALHRSLGDAALQAGNSESTVRRFYLNTHTPDEGRMFFSIIPNASSRRAIVAEVPMQTHPALRAI
jgi:integrase